MVDCALDCRRFRGLGGGGGPKQCGGDTKQNCRLEDWERTEAEQRDSETRSHKLTSHFTGGIFRGSLSFNVPHQVNRRRGSLSFNKSTDALIKSTDASTVSRAVCTFRVEAAAESVPATPAGGSVRGLLN